MQKHLLQRFLSQSGVCWGPVKALTSSSLIVISHNLGSNLSTNVSGKGARWEEHCPGGGEGHLRA